MQKGISIKSWPEDDKPREKMITKGKESLSDAELLALIIGTGSRQKSAVELARDVLLSFEYDLHTISRLNLAELRKIHGIGPAKAVSIMAALELANRRQMSKIKKELLITSSGDAYSYLGPLLGNKSYEEFWILMLNRRNQIIRPYKVSEGGVSGTVADPKKIFKTALEHNASGIILCHNHPSGNLNPSQADINLTKKIKSGGLQLDISILDHLIITARGYYSFADEGSL